MVAQDRDCFINKTADNQLYDIFVQWNINLGITDYKSRICFNNMSLNEQLWLIYQLINTRPRWTPKYIQTVFWYDPSDASTITTSGSNVTQVDDKSGNGYTLTPEVGQNPPLIGTRTLNDLNVLEWTGNNCIENTSFSYDQSATPLNFAFIVYHDTIGVQEFYFSGTQTTTNRIFGRRLSDARHDVAAPTRITTSYTVSDNQPTLILNQLNATNSLVRINGDQKVSGNIGVNAFQILALGHNENEASDLDGYFAEIIGFPDNTQQERVEGYLAWKWGLVANLPAGHPYKNSPPII